MGAPHERPAGEGDLAATSPERDRLEVSLAEWTTIELPLHEYVVRLSESSYQAVGESVTVIPDGDPRMTPEDMSGRPDLVLPGLGRVELIETDTTVEALDPAKTLALRQAGLDVWVIVPRSHLSSARDRLAGAVDRVQPWWLDDKGDQPVLRFGEPEIP